MLSTRKTTSLLFLKPEDKVLGQVDRTKSHRRNVLKPSLCAFLSEENASAVQEDNKEWVLRPRQGFRSPVDLDFIIREFQNAITSRSGCATQEQKDIYLKEVSTLRNMEAETPEGLLVFEFLERFKQRVEKEERLSRVQTKQRAGGAREQQQQRSHKAQKTQANQKPGSDSSLTSQMSSPARQTRGADRLRM